jgi:hypothetical protein
LSGLLVALLALAPGIETRANEPFAIVSRDDSTRVRVNTASPIGIIELWVPEAIMSERGACAIYPNGARWRRVDGAWEQNVDTPQSYGPGNYTRVGDEIECVGVKFPVDSPVSWRTRLTPGLQRVAFEIRLRNTGTKTIRRAGAAVCIKFLDAGCWSDESTLALSGGKSTTLAKLGRDAGDNRFEAYLLRNEEFANPFYDKFWGFNRHRLDRAILVSEHRDEKCFVIASAERAYCMLSNRVNPCTDMMLAFGDIEPGAEATSSGFISIESGPAADFIAQQAKQ